MLQPNNQPSVFARIRGPSSGVKLSLRASVVLTVLAVLLVGVGAGVYAAGPIDAMVGEQAQRLPTEQVEDYWNKLVVDYGGFFPSGTVPSFKEMLTPGGGFSIKSIASGLLKYLFHEVLANGKLLGTIILLTVFSMILETVQSAFEKKAVSKVAYAIIYMVLIVLAINSFTIAIGYAKSAIGGMIQFMVAVVPLLLTMLASMGNMTTVAVMHPLIVFMVHMVGTLIYTVVFPLLFFSTVLYIVSSLSEKYKVTRLANMLRTLGVGLLGFCVMVFLGVISVQGTTGAVTDGVAIRTAKYVAGNFVPVVGRMFSDASETVVGASLLVKNAVGLAGVVVIILLCAFPALKILSLALIYNLSAAVLQPLGDSPIGGCLQTIGKNMMYVFASLAAVGFMFFLAITIMITVGNVSVMMR